MAHDDAPATPSPPAAAAPAGPAHPEAAAHVARLGLAGHPEGGYFSRWYTAPDAVAPAASRGYPPGAARPTATSIHYLLEGGRRSCLHRIRGDELWFWHAGGPLVVVELLPPRLQGAGGGGGSGSGSVAVRRTVLGPDASRGHVLTHAVPGGAYFGAFAPRSTPYALVSCVVAPGFDFADWEMHPAGELTHAVLAGEGGGGGGERSLPDDVRAVIGYLADGGRDALPEA